MSKKVTYLSFIEDIGYSEKNKAGKRSLLAKYQCICGNIKIAPKPSVKYGHIRSCGCLIKKTIIEASTTHGLRKHPLYDVWLNIKNRCYNKSHNFYHLYGGKGVRMCDEWVNDFKIFYDWCITNGWHIGLEVDKDKKGNGLLYSPSTCSLLTHAENSIYRSSSRFILFKGQMKTVSQLAKEYNINAKVVRDRINKLGWELEDALITPTVKFKKKNKSIEIRHAFGFIG